MYPAIAEVHRALAGFSPHERNSISRKALAFTMYAFSPTKVLSRNQTLKLDPLHVALQEDYAA